MVTGQILPRPSFCWPRPLMSQPFAVLQPQYVRIDSLRLYRLTAICYHISSDYITIQDCVNLSWTLTFSICLDVLYSIIQQDISSHLFFRQSFSFYCSFFGSIIILHSSKYLIEKTNEFSTGLSSCQNNAQGFPLFRQVFHNTLPYYATVLFMVLKYVLGSFLSYPSLPDQSTLA